MALPHDVYVPVGLRQVVCGMFIIFSRQSGKGIQIW
jgi:hypothetical protein